MNSAQNPDLAPSPSYQQNSRPGALRVDTSSLDQPNIKQNKSAYPSFAANGVLFPNGETSGSLSPGPVTAGPDLGRQRADFIGYSQVRLSRATVILSPSNVARLFLVSLEYKELFDGAPFFQWF